MFDQYCIPLRIKVNNISNFKHYLGEWKTLLKRFVVIYDFITFASLIIKFGMPKIKQILTDQKLPTLRSIDDKKNVQ